MIVHNINPTILNLGPLEIRWYGLLFVLGFLIVYLYAKKAVLKKKILSLKEFDNFMLLIILATVFGARLFYAVFYNPQYFLKHPLHFFAVWQGGLSFHGSLAAIIIVSLIYCKKKKISFLQLADIFVIPVALANAFGRIGNFINAELYGKITSVAWAVLFPGVESARHPAQLYESFYNIFIFFILFTCRNKFKNKGVIFGLFLILYAVFRFSVEFIKDLPVYGPLTMGQWLTIPMFFLGLWLVFRRK